MKEKMFRLVEEHAQNVSKNVLIRREYEDLKRQAQEKGANPPAAGSAS
jgi:hypothetical protein